jgi:hypothetical protein
MSSFYSTGQILDEPFDAAKFSASGAMTWTVALVDIYTYRYSLVGNLMTMWLSQASETTVGGVVSTILFVRIPAGKTAVKFSHTMGYATSGGTLVPCYTTTTPTNQWINIYRLDGANWTAGLTGVRITVPFEVL